MSIIPPFDRSFFGSEQVASRIGVGELGGKAEGLVRIKGILARELGAAPFADMGLGIPRVAVLATAAFDAFMKRNHLYEVALSKQPDEWIGQAFQQAALPTEVLGDLRALAESVHTPLAIRSSSLLEDALARPLAGIYETKMIPNNQPDPDTRFQRLVEAIKFVYASTFFRGARTYRLAGGLDDREEKMAVMIQEMVGERHRDRFYPHLSAVCRSYSYYPSGPARPEDGVVSLALGLGKTIVDGGICWSYCPRYPQAPPPFGSVRQMLHETQTHFWAVNMGRPLAYDPNAETEYLVESDLVQAEQDGTLSFLASTYDAHSDRLRLGMGGDGPRVLDFAPLLKLGQEPWNELVLALLQLSEQVLEREVEIELAVTLPSRSRPRTRVGFVQVRPMLAPDGSIEVSPEELSAPGLLLSSARALGNGVEDSIRDIVYVRPETFDARSTREIASEIELWNHQLVEQQRPYLLIGFGRWGSSDPWLGIPVQWGQVAGARVIVEAALPNMNIEPSQGSHFFHNLSSFQVKYFTVRPGGPTDIDWSWLNRQPASDQTEWLRHVRLDPPLQVRVDGRSGRGVVQLPATPESADRERDAHLPAAPTGPRP